MEQKKFDTTNKFMVGVQGETIVFMRPVPQRLSKEDALVLGAWIVALATDNPEKDFKLLLDAVLNC
jgi:hypothetical protein